MCLGIPGQIVQIVDRAAHRAVIDVEGVRREVNIGLVVDGSDPVAMGDWVLVHVGFAMAKIDADEAERTLAFVRELEEFIDELDLLGGDPQ
jgi:hydrogenase expression/formation protein HypC